LAYLLGLLSVGVGEELLLRLRLLTPNDLSDAALSRRHLPDPAAARFQVLRQEGELLAGSALAIALLAVAASLHAWRIEGWRRSLTSVAICAVVLASASLWLAVRRHRSASQLILEATPESGSRNAPPK